MNRREILRSQHSADSSRRTFLSGIGVSALGAVGLEGSTDTAAELQSTETRAQKLRQKPSQDPVKTAQVLENRSEFIEALADEGLLGEEVLNKAENPEEFTEGEDIISARFEESGYTGLVFPKESEQLALGFGEKKTDIIITYPDHIDVGEITKKIADKLPGFRHEEDDDPGTEDSHCPDKCCEDYGTCYLCDEVAEDRCTYYYFPVGRCGSYDCATISCGSGECAMLGWGCACCGGGHPWCNAPKCPDPPAFTC